MLGGCWNLNCCGRFLEDSSLVDAILYANLAHRQHAFARKIQAVELLRGFDRCLFSKLKKQITWLIVGLGPSSLDSWDFSPPTQTNNQPLAEKNNVQGDNHPAVMDLQTIIVPLWNANAFK